MRSFCRCRREGEAVPRVAPPVPAPIPIPAPAATTAAAAGGWGAVALSASSGPLVPLPPPVAVVPDTLALSAVVAVGRSNSSSCSCSSSCGGSKVAGSCLCMPWTPASPDASNATPSPSRGMPTWSRSEAAASAAAEGGAAAAAAAAGKAKGVAGTFALEDEEVAGVPVVWAFGDGIDGAAPAAAVPSPPRVAAGGASWSSMVALLCCTVSGIGIGVCTARFIQPATIEHRRPGGRRQVSCGRVCVS
mmetsp:Transcript_14211/g.40786  ORF Transcript_14211/g.40786 Transcript_14211/m.40786 type:complete len:247 (+) Transcript_14211:991-1731(+)